MKTAQVDEDWQQLRQGFLRQIDPDSHFYRVFDALPDIHFYAINRAGQTLFYSAGLPTHYGLHGDVTMRGKNDRDLTPGTLAAKYLAGDAEVCRTGLPWPPVVEVWLDEVGLPVLYVNCKHPIKNRKGVLIGIMGTLCKAGGAASSQFGHRLDAAISLLRADLQTFPAIDLLASCCLVSIRHFQRMFHETFGMSPYTYWMKLRIRSACEGLYDGRESLAQIAARLGFYDQSSFSRHFRKHTGKSPRVFAREGTHHSGFSEASAHKW